MQACAESVCLHQNLTELLRERKNKTRWKHEKAAVKYWCTHIRTIFLFQRPFIV